MSAGPCVCLDKPFRMRLMQNGETSHTAHTALNCCKLVHWLYKSPDLNPIEHILDQIGRMVRRQDPANVRHLQQFEKDGWNGIVRAHV